MKTSDSRVMGFWVLHAYEFIPKGSKLREIEILPKTTFEKIYISRSYKNTRWVVIHYDFKGEYKVRKVSIT